MKKSSDEIVNSFFVDPIINNNNDEFEISEMEGTVGSSVSLSPSNYYLNPPSFPTSEIPLFPHSFQVKKS